MSNKYIALKETARTGFDRLERFWEHCRWVKYNSPVDETGLVLIAFAGGYSLRDMGGALEDVTTFPLFQAACMGLMVARLGAKWLRWSWPTCKQIGEWAPRMALVAAVFSALMVLELGFKTAALALAITFFGAHFLKEFAYPAWASMRDGQRTFEDAESVGKEVVA